MTASPIGILNLGDIVMVSQVKEINGEIWVRLDQEAAERHCFVNDGDAWSIALTRYFHRNDSDFSRGRLIIFQLFPETILNTLKVKLTEKNNVFQQQLVCGSIFFFLQSILFTSF